MCLFVKLDFISEDINLLQCLNCKINQQMQLNHQYITLNGKILKQSRVYHQCLRFMHLRGQGCLCERL